MSVRVRFAPSPTGLLHVGALRTALYCHLYAKSHGGTNILRIEDTDRSRYNPDSEREFVSTLDWVGITFDEGPHVGGRCAPYRQSERKEAGVYAPYIEKLLDSGNAYWAFETSEELEEMRTFQQVNKLPIGYFGGDWRDADPSRVANAKESGKQGVIRLKIPKGPPIKGSDAIRGKLEWDPHTVDDPVLIKADGMPTYHFAAIVDDHLMEITHVFRGSEWLSSFPKHIALYNAFGWDVPVYAHCPVITGDNGQKLSKRHGATRVLDYMAMGVLPDPLKNFVALIGWAPGEDREIMSPDELAQAFDISGIQPSPGKFDLKKLMWMNGNAIRSLTPNQIMKSLSALSKDDHAKDYWSEDDEELGKLKAKETWAAVQLLVENWQKDAAYAEEAVSLTRDRASTLVDFGPMCSFFFTDKVEDNPEATAKWFHEPHVKSLFRDFADALANKESTSIEECEVLVKEWAASHGFEKIGPVVHPTRVALTGRTVGPGLFELMSLLEPKRMVARFEAALEKTS